MDKRAGRWRRGNEGTLASSRKAGVALEALALLPDSLCLAEKPLDYIPKANP